MRFLIAGLGSVGRRHFRNLVALGETDILLLRTGRSTLPDGELSGVPTFPNLESALDQRPDAVIVSNPTALHLEVATPAVQRGLSVLIEKPVSHSWEGMDDLVQAQQTSRARVLVGYQYRFDGGLQQAKRALEEGRIGRPLAARAIYGDHLPAWHPWEDFRNSYSSRPELGGGALLTLSHPLDYLRWMLGEARPLWAVLASQGGWGIPVEDLAQAGFRFESGAIGTVHLDFLQQPPGHLLEIVGSEATLVWDQFARERPDGREGRLWFPEEGPAPNRDAMFLAEMDHFRSVARGEVEPACRLEDGIAALRMALDATEIAQRVTGAPRHLEKRV